MRRGALRGAGGIAWMVAACLAWSCGGAPPPRVGEPVSGAAASGSASRGSAAPSAEMLTAQALQQFETQGAEGARVALLRALAAWEGETGGGPVVWFPAAADAIPQDVLALASFASTADARWVARSEAAGITVFDGQRWQPHFVLAGHTGGVLSLVFSPDGRFLFSSSVDDTVRKWDMASGKQLAEASGNAEVSNLVPSPSGDRFAYRCGHSVCSWRFDAVAPEPRRLRTPEGCLELRHWLDEDTLIAGADGEELCLFNVANGRVEKRVSFITGNLTFPVRGKVFLASLATARSVRVEVWDALAGQRVRGLDTSGSDWTAEPIALPAMSADGARVVAPVAPARVAVWDVSSGSMSHQLTVDRRVGSARSLHDGRWLLPDAQGQGFSVVDAGLQRVDARFDPPAFVYSSLSIAPDGTTIGIGVKQRVQLWSLATGKQLAVLPEPAGLGKVRFHRFSPGGEWVAVLYAQGVVVWDVPGGKALWTHREPAGSELTAVGWDAKNRLLVTSTRQEANAGRGRERGEVRVVPVGDGPAAEAVERITIGAHGGVQLSDDGTVVAVASARGGVEVWDTSRRVVSRRVAVDGKWWLSPDGKRVAILGVPAGAKDGVVRLQLVEIATGGTNVVADVTKLAGALAWQPDGRQLVASVQVQGGAIELVFVNGETTGVTKRVALPPLPGWFFVSLTPDGTTALLRYREGGMTFVRTANGEPVLTMRFGGDGETWLAWSEPGLFDMGGPRASELISCRAGPRVLPFALCALRFRQEGVVFKALGE